MCNAKILIKVRALQEHVKSFHDGDGSFHLRSASFIEFGARNSATSMRYKYFIHFLLHLLLLLLLLLLCHVMRGATTTTTATSNRKIELSLRAIGGSWH